MLAALLILSLGTIASGQSPLTRTPIRDTLYHADGSLVEGVATISWKSFTAVDGSTVTNSYVDAPIVNGVLAIDLTPNEGATPSGLSYRVEYALDNGNRFTETWVVPASGSALTVSAVRVALPPGPGTSVGVGQVNGLAAALGQKADLDTANTFTAEQTIRESAPGADLLGLELQNGSEGVYFKLPPLTQSTTYTLPFNDGLPNYLLTTDGSGNLFWSPGGSGGGGGAGGPAYDLLLNAGSPLPQRTIAGFSSAFQLADNLGQLSTDIDLNFGSSAGTVAAGDDPRFFDAREPLPHAASHGTGGTDPLSPSSIGALGRSNDFMIGTNPSEPVLLLQGAPSQTAGLQEWRDGSGELVGVITQQGSSFFREMGLSTKTGGTTVSQFFQVGGKTKFAFTVTDPVFDIARYDANGVFKDRPLRIQREGNMLANVSLELADASIGSGRLTLTGDYLQVDEVVAPPNPGTGFGRIFLDSATGELSVKKDDGSVVSLEQQQAQGTFAVFTDAETPSGVVDGVNTTFTLAEAPSPPESLTLTVDGVIQELGADFGLTGQTVTFLSAIPQSGQTLLAWYRTSGFDAGGDLSGSFPQPTVTGIRNRTISAESPSDGECLTWNQTAGEWEPGPCAVVTDSLVWHFAGAPGGGAQPMVLTVPDGLTGAQLKDVRIIADTSGTTDTTFNVERCTAGCSSDTPTFAPIYLTDRTLTASTRTALGGAPDDATVAGGDQFRVNFTAVGASAADVTVVLVFEHESYARLDLGFEALTGDCEAICGPVWEAAGLPPNPFGPAPKLGDACVCFGVGLPTRG